MLLDIVPSYVMLLSCGAVDIARFLALNPFSTAISFYILILFIICRFYTASETHVGIRIV